MFCFIFQLNVLLHCYADNMHYRSEFGLVRFYFMLTMLHLFNQKYNKTSNIVNIKMYINVFYLNIF